jgi:TPR repeat protein
VEYLWRDTGLNHERFILLNCYRKAAEKGDVQALMRLSDLYMPGSEAGTDLVEALKWLRLAAMHGEGSANQLMTKLSLDGSVTSRQYDEACRRADDFHRAFGGDASKQ